MALHLLQQQQDKLKLFEIKIKLNNNNCNNPSNKTEIIDCKCGYNKKYLEMNNKLMVECDDCILEI